MDADFEQTASTTESMNLLARPMGFHATCQAEILKTADLGLPLFQCCDCSVEAESVCRHHHLSRLSRGTGDESGFGCRDGQRLLNQQGLSGASHSQTNVPIE